MIKSLPLKGKAEKGPDCSGPFYYFIRFSRVWVLKGVK